MSQVLNQQQTQRSHDAVLSAYFPWDGNNPQLICEMAAEYYDKHGFAVITGHASTNDISSLCKAAHDIIKEFQRTSPSVKGFSYSDDERVSLDKCFLDSAANTTCFPEKQQNDLGPQTVNKIGHAMHDTNPVFQKFSRSPQVKAIAKAVGLDHNSKLVQSMYILKAPRVGAAVPPHRDVTFVTPESGNSDDCVGFWWALKPATLQNGCLYVVPGSHKDDRKQRRFIRQNDLLSFDCDAPTGYDDHHYIPLPVNSGDLVLIHGAVVHKSSQNFSDEGRDAYTIHLVNGSLTPTCWLQRPDHLPFRPLG